VAAKPREVRKKALVKGGFFPLEILWPAPTLGLLRQLHPYRGALRVSICLSAAMASELERVAGSPFVAHSSGG
jgi:hypothetical protein